jgi:hypothetical protein
MKATDLESLLTKHAGGTVVIAGHSNTIPEIANALVGEKKFEQFADDDYGNILCDLSYIRWKGCKGCLAAVLEFYLQINEQKDDR